MAAENVDYEFQLVEALGSRKKWFSAEDFGEDATHGPDIDRGSIVVATEEEFGGSVPTGDYVFGHKLFATLASSCQPEIAYFELAIGVDQEVSGF